MAIVLDEGRVGLDELQAKFARGQQEGHRLLLVFKASVKRHEPGSGSVPFSTVPARVTSEGMDFVRSGQDDVDAVRALFGRVSGVCSIQEVYDLNRPFSQARLGIAALSGEAREIIEEAMRMEIEGAACNDKASWFDRQCRRLERIFC